MYRENRLPQTVRVERLPTGTIRIFPRGPSEIRRNERTIVYARINPRQSRWLLNHQVEACKAFCFSSGWPVTQVIREIAPGVGHKRRKLARLLETPPARLVVLTPAALSRFDYSLLQRTLAQSGCIVTALDQSQEINGEGGALEDLIDAISTTCSRHYGVKRGALLIEEMHKLLRKPA